MVVVRTARREMKGGMKGVGGIELEELEELRADISHVLSSPPKKIKGKTKNKTTRGHSCMIH